MGILLLLVVVVGDGIPDVTYNLIESGFFSFSPIRMIIVVCNTIAIL